MWEKYVLNALENKYMINFHLSPIIANKIRFFFHVHSLQHYHADSLKIGAHTSARTHTHTQKQWYGAGSRGIVRDRMSFAVHFNRNGKCWNSRWSCARSTITAYENALEISWTSSNMKRKHTFESYWRRTKTRNSSNRRYDVTWLSKIKAIRQYVMAFWGARHT